MTKGVEVERIRETVLLENPSQMLCKRVRVDEVPIFIGEKVRTYLAPGFLRQVILIVTIAQHQRRDFILNHDSAAAAILGRPLLHSPAGNVASGAADRKYQRYLSVMMKSCHLKAQIPP